MEKDQQKIRCIFEKNWKAIDFLVDLTNEMKEAPNIHRFVLKFIYDVTTSGRFKGSKLLELGSGANVHNIASASAFFSHITMSDLVQDNVDYLKMWLSSDSSFNPPLDIPAELEGFGGDMERGKKILEARIRSKVRCVVRCDVVSENVLLEETNDPWTSQPFDMIISCFTMEVAPKDFANFCKSLKNINKLLKPGGGLIMCGYLHGSCWAMQDIWYNHIDLGENDILVALSEAGFGNLQFHTKEGTEKITGFSYGKVYCVAAEKL